MDEGSIFSGGAVRVVESQMPIETGLVLTHISAQTEGSYGEYYVFIDGELVFLGGLSASTASTVTQPMSPILVRPGRLLRIEFRTSNNALPLVNLQGYAVSKGAICR